METEAPDVTVSLEPGGGKEKSENAAAWFNESTLKVPERIRTEDGETAVWIELVLPSAP